MKTKLKKKGVHENLPWVNVTLMFPVLFLLKN